ncbi:MAG: MarR family transcriptional regulator [Chloroflexota bacterium]
MATLRERIVIYLQNYPGSTDREITDALNGHSAPQQPVNQTCHKLENTGILIRRKRPDGLIGNYLTSNASTFAISQKPLVNQKAVDDHLTEGNVKKTLEKWLVNQGWQVQVAWGHSHGIDIDAKRGMQRWVIEVKGGGSLQPMRVNYFLGVLGEVLQRMDDPDASYSIAFPDMQQFRNLWDRLPSLAKKRTQITALFVDGEGNIDRIV